jgi:hypothetical protein
MTAYPAAATRTAVGRKTGTRAVAAVAGDELLERAGRMQPGHRPHLIAELAARFGG